MCEKGLHAHVVSKGGTSMLSMAVNGMPYNRRLGKSKEISERIFGNVVIEMKRLYVWLNPRIEYKGLRRVTAVHSRTFDGLKTFLTWLVMAFGCHCRRCKD